MPDFSPSLVHRRLAAETERSHAYPHDKEDAEGDIAAWRAAWRAKLVELLGLHRMPGRGGSDPPPLNPRTLWRREQRDALGTIEKLVFTAERGADVPAYLCLPHESAPGGRPLPVFICLQGHTSGMHLSIACDAADEHTPISVKGERDLALHCLRRGIAALCIEQRAFGERAERAQEDVCRHNGCHDALMHALILGRTLMGERVYDVTRGISLLHELAGERGNELPIDPSRLGCMGHSSGGMVSMFTAAVDERVRWAMLSCNFSRYDESVMRVYRCGDTYIPSLLLHAEIAEIVGLIAPRPVVIVSGTQDPIVPVESARREFERVRAIYADAEAADRCRHVVCGGGGGGHRFYADAAWDAMLPLMEEPRR